MIVVAEASGHQVAPADVAARIPDLVADVRPTLAVVLVLGAVITVAAIAIEAVSVVEAHSEAKIVVVTGPEAEIAVVAVMITIGTGWR